MVLVSRSVLVVAVPLSTAGSPFRSSLIYAYVLVPAPMFPVALKFRPSPRGLSSPLARLACMAHELETQGAGDRRGLDQFDGDRVAEPVGFGIADKGAASFVEAEILVADKAGRDKAVGAGLVELDEQSGARHTGNMPAKGRPDAVGQKVRDQPIRGLT